MALNLLLSDSGPLKLNFWPRLFCLAFLAIATIEQPLTVAIAKTAGNTDPYL